MKQLGVWVMVGLLCSIVACKQVALYDRIAHVKGGNWVGDSVLLFPFDISDTTKTYQVYVTIRHTFSYPYRNLWLKIGLKPSGVDTFALQQFNLPLASATQWLGTGMDDVYERRVLLFQQPIHFNTSGQSIFSLQHTMRQNPLPGILQAGIRIEPIP